MKKQTLYLSKPLTLNGNEIENINFKCKNITILNLNVNIENYEKIMKYFNDNNIFYREVIEGFISDDDFGNNFGNNNFDNFENNNFEKNKQQPIIQQQNQQPQQIIQQNQQQQNQQPIPKKDELFALLEKIKQPKDLTDIKFSGDNCYVSKESIPKGKKIKEDVVIPNGIYPTNDFEAVIVAKIFNNGKSISERHQLFLFEGLKCYLDICNLYERHRRLNKCKDNKQCLCNTKFNNINTQRLKEYLTSENSTEEFLMDDITDTTTFEDSENVENPNLTDEERILNLLKKVKQFNLNNNFSELCYNKNNIPEKKKIIDITIPKGIYLTTEDEVVFISRIFNTNGLCYSQHELIYYAEKDCYLEPFKLYCRHMTRCKKDRKNCLCYILQKHKKDYDVYKHYLLNDDVIF